jgi:hypothetical protein
MTINELVAKYIDLRDRKEAIRKEATEKTAKIDAVLRKIENVLIASLDAAGVESAKTQDGTAFVATRSSATVADRDAFLGFVVEHDAFDMLESRCSKVAVEQWLEVNGELPPGVNYRTERTINVRRPQARG